VELNDDFVQFGTEPTQEFDFYGISRTELAEYDDPDFEKTPGRDMC